jgi:hypothetical protein
VNDRVFKIGSAIKADLTRLKKQFPQLARQTSFTSIDLKEYAVQRGIISRKDSGSLDALVEKLLGMFLSKNDALRKCDDWEAVQLSQQLTEYAASDVVASRMIFEEASKVAPLDHVQYSSPAGTKVGLLVQEGGTVAAYGTIAKHQPSLLGNVRVKVPTKSRLVIDVDNVLIPSAAAILHLLPSQGGKTKSGALTLGQLQASSSSTSFLVVCPLSLLIFNSCDKVCSSQLKIELI